MSSLDPSSVLKRRAHLRAEQDRLKRRRLARNRERRFDYIHRRILKLAFPIRITGDVRRAWKLGDDNAHALKYISSIVDAMNEESVDRAAKYTVNELIQCNGEGWSEYEIDIEPCESETRDLDAALKNL